MIHRAEGLPVFVEDTAVADTAAAAGEAQQLESL